MPTVVDNLFIFDSSLNLKDERTQEDALIYYFPNDHHVEDKVRRQGIAEAYIAFSQ
jgi:hypothetical protein